MPDDLNIDLEGIGLRLKEIRGEMTQKDFGAKVGFSRSYVNSVERGVKPSVEYLVRISQVYKVSIDWVLTAQKYGRAEDPRTLFAGMFGLNVRNIIRDSVHSSEYTADEIASKMSDLLGVEITINTLASWVSLEPGSYVMPAEYFPAFVKATDSVEAIKNMATLCGAYALSSEQMAAVMLLLTPEKRIIFLKKVIEEGMDEIADPALQGVIITLKKMDEENVTDIIKWARKQLDDVVLNYLDELHLLADFDEMKVR